MVFIRPEDVSLQQCRGIESIDQNVFMVLVQAPIELVAQAFSQLRQAEIWVRDVYEREVEIIGQGVMVFQFRGHSWTLINRLCDPPYGSGLPRQVGATEEDAQNLSDLLHTRAIYYTASDTSGTIEYQLYQDGKSVERLFFEEGFSVQFQSQLRQLEAEDIENAYSFTMNFIREQDAYVPVLFVSKCRSVGQQMILQLENLSRDNLERMDYIAYR
jgi:hypothetical protein